MQKVNHNSCRCGAYLSDPNRKSDGPHYLYTITEQRIPPSIIWHGIFMDVYLVVIKLHPFWLDIGGGPKGVFALQGM